MSLTDHLDAPPIARIHGTPCSVGDLYATLPLEEVAALDRMLYDLGWTARQVWDAITAEGHNVAWSQIGKHRRGHCRCNKDSK